MTRDERKAFLQEQGILPPDEDGLMPFPGEQPTTAPGPGDEIMQPGSAEPPKPADPAVTVAPGQSSVIGNALAGAGRSYARAYGVDAPEPKPNPNDPKEKLKALQTPEFMQWLRAKAGAGAPR